MSLAWVEELLSVWFPLSLAVASYRCPEIDSMAQTGIRGPLGMPSADMTWVIDVGLVFDSLPERVREVLLCQFGLDMGVRKTARTVKAHPQQVLRWTDDGLEMMNKALRNKGLRVPIHIAARY